MWRTLIQRRGNRNQGERILLNTVHQWRVYFDINSPFLEATDTLCNDFLDKIGTD